MQRNTRTSQGKKQQEENEIDCKLLHKIQKKVYALDNIVLDRTASVKEREKRMIFFFLCNSFLFLLLFNNSTGGMKERKKNEIVSVILVTFFLIALCSRKERTRPKHIWWALFLSLFRSIPHRSLNLACIHRVPHWNSILPLLMQLRLLCTHCMHASHTQTVYSLYSL